MSLGQRLAKNMFPYQRGNGRWFIGLRDNPEDIPLGLQFYVWYSFDDAELGIALLATQMIA